MGIEEIGVSQTLGIDGMLKMMTALAIREFRRDKMKVLRFEATTNADIVILQQNQTAMIMAEMIYHLARS